MSVQRRFLVLACACALITVLCGSIGTAVMLRLPQVAQPWMQLGGVMIVLASVITACVALWHVFSAVTALLRLARVGGKHAIPTTQAALALTALEYWCAPWVRRIAVGSLAVGMSATGVSICLSSQAMAAPLFEEASPKVVTLTSGDDQGDIQPGDDLGWLPAPDPSTEPGDRSEPTPPAPQTPEPGSSENPAEHPDVEGAQDEASGAPDTPSQEGGSTVRTGEDRSPDSGHMAGPVAPEESGDAENAAGLTQAESQRTSPGGSQGHGSHTSGASTGSRSAGTNSKPRKGSGLLARPQSPSSELGWVSTAGGLGSYPLQWSPTLLSQYVQHRFSLHTSPPSQPADEPTIQDEREYLRVAEGDCLWDLTAQHLGATSHSDRDIDLVATQWPALYERNRDVIGSDPSLIFPGTTLTIPDQWRDHA